MDENNNKNVEKKVVEGTGTVQTKEKKPMDPKTKKILTFSIIGGVALVALIIIIILIATLAGKPNKKEAEKIVKDFLEAMNDADEEKFIKAIDTEGFIIFNEEGEKKFDKKYNDKKKYIKEYLENEDIDDLEEAEEDLASAFKSSYRYSSTEYSLNEISSTEKSSKSKKIKIIKAKLKAKGSYSTDNKTVKFYVIKVSGKYKIVGIDL